MTVIAIVGGTGPQGKGLGYRFARGGHEVVLGSRSEERARVAASELCVNPLGFDKQGPYGLDLGPDLAAESAQGIVVDSNVVGAFHHLSASALSSDTDLLDSEDVLVGGDDAEAKERVIQLAASVTGQPGIDAGPLRMARQLESLTAVLISVNKKYKVRSGIALVGLD